jgi:hypothetical protein
MRFQEFNRFWELRKKHGRNRKISSPQEFAEYFIEYVESKEGDPLIKKEAKVVSGGAGKGSSIEYAELELMRAFTKDGFALFCGLCRWEIVESYKDENVDFSEIIHAIEKVIYTHNFEGAAANLLNSNIIARQLGLKDHSQIEQETKIKIGAEANGIKIEYVDENGKKVDVSKL